MSTDRLHAIVMAGRVLRYPRDGWADDLHSFAAFAHTLDCRSAAAVQALADRAGGESIGSLQEMFTETFDLTPACALEVGWHLFGEDYERGAFLVRVREQLRAHGIDEGVELPDHLASLLALVGHDPENVHALIGDALVPATGKMLAALETNRSPFHPVMDALSELLAAEAASTMESAHG